MLEIIKSFVNGTSTEKLAIISNISTILGVSVATIVAGPFLQQFADQEFIVSDFIIAIIFYFLYISITMSIIYNLSLKAYKSYQEKKFNFLFSNITLSLITAWIAIAFFTTTKYHFGNIFDSEYLLSKPASHAISRVSVLEISNDGKKAYIKGKIEFKTNITSSDFEILLYTKSGSGLYQSVKTNGDDYISKSNMDGSFTLIASPLYGETLQDMYIVIYRKSDWSFIETFGYGKTGYPNNTTQVPDSSIEHLKAFTYKLQK